MPVINRRPFKAYRLCKKLTTAYYLSFRMESIFLKIPDLGEKILKELDNQSLVQSKEVQRSWNNFINEEKVLWIRIIQKCISDVDIYSIAWRKVLTKAPIEFVIHVALATQKYHAKYKTRVQYSPISVAASDGSLDFYKQWSDSIRSCRIFVICIVNT